MAEAGKLRMTVFSNPPPAPCAVCGRVGYFAHPYGRIVCSRLCLRVLRHREKAARRGR